MQEGKFKKKWVKIYASLKDGTITLATDTPDQNGAIRARRDFSCVAGMRIC